MEVPQKLVSHLGATMPGIWQDIDYLRYQAGMHLPSIALQSKWPANVFIPEQLLRNYIALRKNSSPNEDLDINTLTLMVGTALAWRPTQDIVKFDPSVYEELKYTDRNSILPVDILKQLPAWSIYFETPDLYLADKKFQGFFATMWMADDNHNEQCGLYLNFTDGDKYEVFSITIDEKPLEVLVRNISNSTVINTQERMITNMPGIFHALNMVIYICSYGLVDTINSGISTTSYPLPKKTKKGWRIFPPDKPHIRNIGKQFGEIIRKAHSGGGAKQGSKMRPHIRRSHWHRYWKGPRKGDNHERKVYAKWMPIIMVGGGNQNDESDK